jgi:hypothetical protein
MPEGAKRNSTMKKLITLFAVLGMVLALAPAAQAAVIAPLDGETVYRVIFKYSTVMPNTSTNIAFYNGLIDTEGDAEIVSDWRAIVSTGTGVNSAIENTGTTATDGLAASGDVPIYNIKGELVWAGNAAMWDGTTTPQGNFDSTLNPGPTFPLGTTGLILNMAGGTALVGGGDYQRNWTGTDSDGTGINGSEMGLSTGARGMNANGWHMTGQAWIDAGINIPNTTAMGMYGLSGVIGATSTSTPGTLIFVQ